MAQTVNGTDLETGAPQAGDRKEATRALTVYLNDHLAGATAGAHLARRLVRHHSNPNTARELVALADEIDEDRMTLLSLMRELGIPVRRLMVFGGLLGEQAARLKSNGRILRRSRLRPVIELEAMLLGVQGKAALWRLLGTLPEVDRGSRAEQLSGLLSRADRQAETLEFLREEAAVHTMTGGTRPPAWAGD